MFGVNPALKRRGTAHLALLAAPLVAAGTLATTAMTAHAAPPVNCAGLAAALAGAGDGDTITLSDDHLCAGSFNLPTTIHITLQGADANQGFDNTAGSTSILTGGSSKGTTIQNLVFKNSTLSSSGSGAAISLTGDHGTTITNCTFVNNHTSANSGSSGGAVSLTSAAGPVVLSGNTFGSLTTQALGNSAATGGGGLLAPANNVTLTNNVFGYNTAGVQGGGLALVGANSPAGPTTLTGNTFAHNKVLSGSIAFAAQPAAGPRVSITGPITRGGGAFVDNEQGGTQVAQAHNVFDSNSVAAPASGFIAFAQPHADSTADTKWGGGGEWILGGSSTSLDDKFTSNTLVPAPAPVFTAQPNAPAPTVVEADGGGLGIEASDLTAGATFSGENLVAAGNTISPGGEGAGIYAGLISTCNPNCPITLTLKDSTVAGNDAGNGTGGSGVAGDAFDTATIINSIVAGDSGSSSEIAGFDTTTLSYTDSCAGTGFTGGAYPGTGNTCIDPKLKNPGPGVADVHQTQASPTIDAGLNSLVPAGLTADYEGDPRIQGARVDMGADEV
ncbi:MAG: choice-of-anchor Q domain-containing protein, partial [Candidatus Dormiibacterota bacterium]